MYFSCRSIRILLQPMRSCLVLPIISLLVILHGVHSWPRFLLAHSCAKGLALVSGSSLPRIMNVIPTEDPTALDISCSDALDVACNEALARGSSLPVGTSVELVYTGLMVPDTRTAFVTSQGHLIGSESCGHAGSSLLTNGWLNRASWIPTQTGVAQVAVGFAHGSFGTPAVTVAIKTLRISPKPNTTIEVSDLSGSTSLQDTDGGLTAYIGKQMQHEQLSNLTIVENESSLSSCKNARTNRMRSRRPISESHRA